ncbi:MAG: hypothetical protein QXW79_00590 [Thermoplasmata archaeon]
MGNRNAGQDREQSKIEKEEKSKNLYEEYGKYKLHHCNVDDLLENIQKSSESHPKSQISYYNDPIKKISLPYEIGRDVFSIESSKSMPIEVLSSEGPKYVEFIVCSSDIHDLRREKYAIHKNTPTHECKANCGCIKKLAKIHQTHGTESLEFSPTSSINVYQLGGANDSSNSSEEPKKKTDSKNSPIEEKKKKKHETEEEEEELEKELDKELNEEENVPEIEISEEELKDIEDEDEEPVTESASFEQSEITTSDLYRIQSRVFKSETESLKEDEDFSEQVAQAIKRTEQQKKIFNTEDKTILGMESSSSQFMRKPVRKNVKYN